MNYKIKIIIDTTKNSFLNSRLHLMSQNIQAVCFFITNQIKYLYSEIHNQGKVHHSDEFHGLVSSFPYPITSTIAEGLKQLLFNTFQNSKILLFNALKVKVYL